MMNSHISDVKRNSTTTQQLLSSGIPALDVLIGGGLPIGTISIIEEDLHGAYSRVVLKYFLAEGLASEHSLFVASQDTSPYKLVKDLPAVIDTDPSTDLSSKSIPNEAERLKIAFRYEKLPVDNDTSSQLKTSGHHFDLTKTVPPDQLEKADICCWDGCKMENCNDNFSNQAYGVLLNNIKETIKRGKFFLKDNPHKSVLRIGIHSLGSPMWIPQLNSHLNNDEPNRDLDRFIFSLRALVRSAFAVAVITIPSHLYREDCLQRCRHSSDITMKLQSFAGTDLEFNPVLSEYHGFFHVTKLAPINSFISRHPGTIEYVFKLRRKKFVIEKLHLPPGFIVEIGIGTLGEVVELIIDITDMLWVMPHICRDSGRRQFSPYTFIVRK